MEPFFSSPRSILLIKWRNDVGSSQGKMTKVSQLIFHGGKFFARENQLSRTIKVCFISRNMFPFSVPFFGSCMWILSSTEKTELRRRQQNRNFSFSLTRPLSKAIIFHHNEMIIYFIVVSTLLRSSPSTENWNQRRLSSLL